MKAVLVIDVPTDCRRCQLMVDRFCYGIPADEVHGNININERPKWCPLKPMPTYDWYEEGKENECEEWYRNGWNACLDAITGDTNADS